MPPDHSFRRNFFVIAALHIVAVVVLFFGSMWLRKPHPDSVLWLEDGSIGGGETGAGAAAPEARPTRAANESKPQPPPPPAPRHELVALPPPVQAPSELVTPQATPPPHTPKLSIPKPETPRPPETPKPHTPKPTPKPTPHHAPKPKPATPKATPGEEAEGAEATPKPKASPVAKPKHTPGVVKNLAAGSSATKPEGAPGGNGAGSGNGKGPAKTGNGVGSSQFGWYLSMIHDRFHSRWDQPTNISRNGQDIVTTIKIRIGADGTIQSREIVHSSGDTTMDQSVMTAAEQVRQIDPLPSGLGNGQFFEVNVAFKLEQDQ